MANALFINDSWSSNATIVGGAKDASTPWENLLDIKPTRIVLSSISAEGLQVDLDGPSQLIDSFAMIFTTTASNHTWRIRGASSLGNLGVNDLIDSGAIPFWPQPGLEVFPFRHAFYRHPTPQTCSAVRISISGLPQFSVGHLKISLGFQPSFNFLWQDFAFGWRDPSEITEVPSGPPHILAYPRRLGARMTFDAQNFADAYTFADMTYLYGGSHPVFVVRDPDDDLTAHYGMINALLQFTDPPVVASAVVNRYRVSIGMTEYGV